MRQKLTMTALAAVLTAAVWSLTPSTSYAQAGDGGNGGNGGNATASGNNTATGGDGGNATITNYRRVKVKGNRNFRARGGDGGDAVAANIAVGGRGGNGGRGGDD